VTTSPDPIPDDVRRFIVEHIDSVPALEALLLMRRSPDRRWTAEELAAELYVESRHVAPVVAALGTRGLCGVDGTPPRYYWSPATPDLAARLQRLAEAYAAYLVAVTNIIHSKPRPSVRGFSDAFRLRGPE
jgi:hypothetical protein